MNGYPQSVALSKYKFIPCIDSHTNKDIFVQMIEEIIDTTIDFKVIYIVSSLEMFSINADIYSTIMEKLVKKLNVELVSNGCVSFHSVLLEFISSAHSDAAVIFLENEREKLQHFMDCLGFSMNSKEWLSPQPGSAYCLLTKSISVNELGSQPELWINDVSILPLANGGDVIATVQNVANELIKLSNKKLKVVSFRNNTKFSKVMLRLIDSILSEKEISVANWLPSGESGSNHYHSLKPLIEIEQYKQFLRAGDILVILTLGNGGRVGIIVVSKHNSALKSDIVSNAIMAGIVYKDYYYSSIFNMQKENDIFKVTPENIEKEICGNNIDYLNTNNCYFKWGFID